MNCPKCGLENPDSAQFCMRCGKEMRANVEPPADEFKSCYRHPKEKTQLSCGKCGRPLCTKCVILGPAGPRCPDCAKLTVPIRPGAVAYDLSRGVRNIFRSGPWTIYIWILLIGMVVSGIRGCGMLNQPRQRPPMEIKETAPDER